MCTKTGVQKCTMPDLFVFVKKGPKSLETRILRAGDGEMGGAEAVWEGQMADVTCVQGGGSHWKPAWAPPLGGYMWRHGGWRTVIASCHLAEFTITD